MNKKVGIILNAPYLDVRIEEQQIICADGGVKFAVGNFTPVAVVGDFDSARLTEEEKRFFSSNAQIITCPTVKDYTDGERAVLLAKELGYEEVVIYGVEGGRSDHVYANYALLCYANTLGLKGKINNLSCDVFYVDDSKNEWTFSAKIGTTVSVIPFAGSVVIESSVGLAYPYNTLALSCARTGVGVSNYTKTPTFSLRIKHGGALVFINKSNV